MTDGKGAGSADAGADIDVDADGADAAPSANGHGPGNGHAWEHLEWTRATDNPDPDAECIEIAESADGLVHIRQTDDPGHVVTTTRAKWHAFVLGVRNNEFDHFVEEPRDEG